MKHFLIFALLLSSLFITNPVQSASSSTTYTVSGGIENIITLPQQNNEFLGYQVLTNGITYEKIEVYINNNLAYTGGTVGGLQFPSPLTLSDDTVYLIGYVKEKGKINVYNNFTANLTHNYSLPDDTSPPVFSNVTFSETTLTGKNVYVSFEVTDLSELSAVKHSSGERDISYFSTNGTTLDSLNQSIFSISISTNGTYTLYAKDILGYESIYVFTVNNIEKSPPVLSATDTNNPTPTNEAIINVETSDNNGIKQLKWANGTQSVSYFITSGNSIPNNQFSVTTNGTYTIFAEDTIGNTTIQTISITRLPVSQDNLWTNPFYYAYQTIYAVPPAPVGGFPFSVSAVRLLIVDEFNTVYTSQTGLPSQDFSFIANPAWPETLFIKRQTYDGKTYKDYDISDSFKVYDILATDKLTYDNEETITAYWGAESDSDFTVELVNDDTNQTIQESIVTQNTIQFSNLPSGNYRIDIYYSNSLEGNKTESSQTFSVLPPFQEYENIFEHFGSINFGTIQTKPGENQTINAINIDNPSLQFIQGNPTKSKFEITMQLSPFTTPSGNTMSASNFSISGAQKKSGSSTTSTGTFSFVDSTPTILLDLSSSESNFSESNSLVINPANVHLTIPSDLVVNQTEEFTSTITYSVILFP